MHGGLDRSIILCFHARLKTYGIHFMIGALLHGDSVQLSQPQFLSSFAIDFPLAGMNGIDKTPVSVLILCGKAVRIHCRMTCPGMVRQWKVFVYKSDTVTVF